MAGHELIAAQVEALARRLPPDTVDELADGLLEAWQARQAIGETPTAAARSVVAEFGDPDQLVAAFVSQSPGRRIATRLLMSGPVAGALWATTFITAQAWVWPIPRFVAAGFGVALVGLVVLLVTAATSHDYRRTQRLGAVGGLGTIVLDAALLAALLAVNPDAGWAMTAATSASLTRMVLTARRLNVAVSR